MLLPKIARKIFLLQELSKNDFQMSKFFDKWKKINSFKTPVTPLYKKFRYLQIDLREARKKFLTVFSNLLCGFSLKILENSLYLNDNYLQIDRAKRERKFLTVF